jgi:hypothetical protein
LFALKFDLKKRMIIAFIPIIINVFLSLNANGWYGHRYMVFSAIPFLLLPFGLLLKNLMEKGILKKWLIIFFFISIFPIVSMIAFDGNSTNLTLHLKEQYFGIIDWGNKYYQIEIWKTLFLYPLEFFKACFKGGLLYLIYLTAQIFHLNKFLPAIVLEKYSVFNLRIFFKTIIIYIFPFILYFIYFLIIKIKNRKLKKLT